MSKLVKERGARQTGINRAKRASEKLIKSRLHAHASAASDFHLSGTGPLSSYEPVVGLAEHECVVDQLRQRVQELQAIHRLSEAINRTEAIEDLYEVALNELQRTVKADRVGVLLFDREGTLRFRAWRGLSESYREAAEIYLSEARDAMDAKPIFIRDSHRTTRLELLLAAILEEGIRALGYVPLMHRGALLGRLNICYETPHKFGPEETQLIQTVAAHIAFAIGRKQGERELRASEGRYRSLFERNLSGVCTTALDGDILDCNESFARIFGYESRDEVLSAGASALYPRPEERSAFLSTLLKHRTLSNIELHLKRKDGTPVWLLGNATLVQGDESHPMQVEGIWMDITERKVAEDELRRSRERLRALSAHLQSVREEERTRIAREIHDELGQTLTRLKIDLSLLNDELPEDGKHLGRKTEFMGRLLEGTIQSVGRICTELRPSLLDNLGLTAAIEQELLEFGKRTGIRCSFISRPKHPALEQEVATTLFRIFQEALTNIARHADANRVDTRLTRKNGSAALTIRDDGKGIPEDSIRDPRSLGLIGMRERARQLGGKLSVNGKSGTGTLIAVSIPVPWTKEQREIQ